MVAFIADVDDREAHALKVTARDAWRAAERRKVAALLRAHPGGFAYDTRGGYRLVSFTAVDQFKWSSHVETVVVFQSLARST